MDNVCWFNGDPVHPAVEKGVRLWRATRALSNRADGIPQAIGSTALPMDVGA